MERKIGKAWDKGRELTGVLCDRKVLTRRKVVMCKVCIQLALLYGNEIWPLTHHLENRISSTEMRMFIHGISLEEHKRNEEIRDIARVNPVTVLMRKRRLEWCRRICRKDKEDMKRIDNISVEDRRRDKGQNNGG